MFSYVATVFEDTGGNLSPNTSAIIIGVIQLIGMHLFCIKIRI